MEFPIAPFGHENLGTNWFGGKKNLSHMTVSSKAFYFFFNNSQ